MAEKTNLLQRILPKKKKENRYGELMPVGEMTLSEADAYAFDGGVSISTLLGSGRRIARQRAPIYEKWSFMEGDAIVSTALKLLVTTALGGHETTGDVVFIEKSPLAEADKTKGKIVDEISAALSDLFNEHAYTVAYNGAAFGDAYARIYASEKVGLRDIYTAELVRPTLIQPFERGNETVGYFAYGTGNKALEQLTVKQLARLKMPRTQWIPQQSITEKAYRAALREDDPDNLPILPSMVGGSLLYQAEEAYDNLYAALLGLVGQRWIDSIDERMMTVNMDGMTKDQKENFMTSLKTMLTASKTRAEAAAKGGRPVLERIFNLIPVFSEKQLVSVTGDMGSGQKAGSMTVDDVMLHAKLLAGAMGTDIAMLGFSEILSGGLGEGGFFRVSAQAAESSRVIRVALKAFFNHLINIHTYHRYGIVFPKEERPWQVNFYGSISALESERAKTRMDKMSAGSILATTMQQLKDMALGDEATQQFLVKEMMLDEDEAKVYAKALAAAPPSEGMEGDEGGPRRGPL